jgi:hypothetical protein
MRLLSPLDRWGLPPKIGLLGSSPRMPLHGQVALRAVQFLGSWVVTVILSLETKWIFLANCHRILGALIGRPRLQVCVVG